MEKTGMIGVDLGKRSFQLRGVRGDGTAIFRKKVSRERFLAEVSERGPCVVAPQGIANVARLAAAVDDPETRLPETVRAPGRELLEQIGILDAKIGEAGRGGAQAGEGERRSEALDGHPGNRSRLRHGGPGLRAADGGLPARARLLGLARPGSPPVLDRGGGSRSSAGSRRWGSATSGGCPLLERSWSSDRHRGVEPTILGWPRC